MTAPTNAELRTIAEAGFEDGLLLPEVLHRWFERHVPHLQVDREHWLAYAVVNFINDPELAPYLIDRGKLHDLRQTVREQERRYVYEYLKAEAESVHEYRAARTSPMIVGNILVRLAGEILRGRHVQPVKINNPELWK